VKEDLIRRLRRTPLYDGAGESADDLTDEAADALEAAQAEVEGLKNLLEWAMNSGSGIEPFVGLFSDNWEDGSCWGCDAQPHRRRIGNDRRWEDFPHSDGCKYAAARAALSSPVQKDPQS